MQFFWFLLGCTLLFSQVGAQQQWAGKTNVFVGDSYTEGKGLSTVSDRFSTVLTTSKVAWKTTGVIADVL